MSSGGTFGALFPCAGFEHGKHRVRDMQNFRPAFALHPRRFGRGPARVMSSQAGPTWTLSDDFKLFATTFVAGFVFVTILIS